ncbi:MAG TPA: ABC transporter permease, partial [Puia sp.]|nr:ABC transporter permease [Puia sp.]
MRILIATIVKDIKILLRDRVGLFMMFFMPVLLVVVITSVQNSTFELVNNNKISLIIYDDDKDSLSTQLIESIRKMGMFNLQISDSAIKESEISSQMRSRDALVALVIPKNFTGFIQKKA